MLVVGTVRLDEDHSRQRPVSGRLPECLHVLQVTLAQFGAWRIFGEVVVGLVMRLEIDYAVDVVDDAAVRQRHVPTLRIPRPIDALLRQKVADGRLRLRGQRTLGGVCETRIAPWRRRNSTWLVRRLNRVHHVIVWRDAAVTGPDRRSLEGGPWRGRRKLQIPGVVEFGAHGRRRVLVDGRASAGEPEMVEVGASKSSHEKLVGKSEFRSQLV